MYNPNQFMGQPSGYPYQDSVQMYQQRLNNMAQQVTGQGQNGLNSMFQFPMQMPSNQMQNVSVRAVTGYEEAMASQIPLDGSVSIFTDFSHSRIYTKQLNMQDGTALIKTYKLAENPVPAKEPVENSVEYVKKSEFDELKTRFDEVWNALTEKPDTAKSTSKKEGNK